MVDPARFAKRVVPRFAPNVKNIAALRFAFEVDQMNNALGIDRGLRLNAAARCAKQADFCRVCPACPAQQTQKEGAEPKTDECCFLI